jgi:hypothetical protein
VYLHVTFQKLNQKEYHSNSSTDEMVEYNLVNILLKKEATLQVIITNVKNELNFQP